MKVRPLHDRLIVRRHEEGDQHVGRIIIPDSAKEKPQRGAVLSAGAGKTNDDGTRVALDVRAGDEILFGKYSGQEITLEGVAYLIMKEDDVLAVIDDPAAPKRTVITGRAATKAITKKSKAVRSKGTSRKKAQRPPQRKR